jgi:hypothetical protein
MFKSLLNILLSALILLNGMTYSLLQLDFNVNRAQITELFCINQDKPELACNGQCELTRRLDKAHEQEENKRTFLQEQLNLVFMLPDQTLSPLLDWSTFHTLYFVLDEMVTFIKNIADFFHPPQI